MAIKKIGSLKKGDVIVATVEFQVDEVGMMDNGLNNGGDVLFTIIGHQVAGVPVNGKFIAPSYDTVEVVRTDTLIKRFWRWLTEEVHARPTKSKVSKVIEAKGKEIPLVFAGK